VRGRITAHGPRRASAFAHPPHAPFPSPFPSLPPAGVRLDAAHGQLQRYYEGVSSNKALVMKLLGIIVTFMVFFAIFLA
jgi:hypothetical protein